MKAYVGGQTAALCGPCLEDLEQAAAADRGGDHARVLALILAFRTVVVPAQAALMNLLSIGASYGVLTAIFQYGWAIGLFGHSGPVPIVSYVPLFMFAILFGLSMDYEVFLVSQIEEHVHEGEDNKGSVVAGLVTSARVITAAASIMVFVFGSFVLNGNPTVQQFGVGLAVAVLLDATVVRCLLGPRADDPDGQDQLVHATLARPDRPPVQHRRRRVLRAARPDRSSRTRTIASLVGLAADARGSPGSGPQEVGRTGKRAPGREAAHQQRRSGGLWRGPYRACAWRDERAFALR